MEKDFEEIREQVEILDLAQCLMKRGKRPTLFYYPNEKTPSIRIYEDTRSFYDFGRTVGGDCIKLYSHIKKCNQWTAVQEIRELYNIGKEPNKEDVREKIQRQKMERKRKQQREQEFKMAWRKEVEFLKWWEEVCKQALKERRFPPFSESQASLVAELQKVSYKLDVLCAVNQKDYQRLKPEAQRGFSSDRPQWLLDILLILKEDGLFAATQEELEEIQAQREFERNRTPGVDRKFRITWFKNNETE